MTKIGGENGGRLLAKKRLVKRAKVLRRNKVKFEALIRRFIVVSDRKDGVSDGRNDRPG